MSVKAGIFELKVFANGEVIGESKDVGLCLTVLDRLQRGERGGRESCSGKLATGLSAALGGEGLGNDGALAKFSETIGVSPEVICGVLDPTAEEPYMHIDLRVWSEWSKKLPPRGPGSISSASFGATLLALWFHCAGLGTPRMRQSQAMLSEIGVEGKNPGRSIKNCGWVQLRSGDTIRVNPASFDKAVEVVKAFCERRVPDVK